MSLRIFHPELCVGLFQTSLHLDALLQVSFAKAGVRPQVLPLFLLFRFEAHRCSIIEKGKLSLPSAA